MRLATWLAVAVREARGSTGRIVFFAACLAVGVAAVVAVTGLSAALDTAIRGRARELLAADLAISSRRPIPPEVERAAAAIPAARLAHVREMPTMVRAAAPDGAGGAGPSLLCGLKAVAPGYPFYGVVVTEPAAPLERLLAGSRVVVAEEVLTRLGISVGDDLMIGGERFTVSAVVRSEPDRMDVGLTIGPRVLLSISGLERSGLAAAGSLVDHRLLVALPTPVDAALARAVEIIGAAIERPEFVELETAAEAQPALRSALDRVERFLGLVALLSLLIGGIGVAQAIRAWLAGRLDAIAVLRALGARPREVVGLYLAQTAALAFIGSLLGAAVGAIVARLVPGLLDGMLPVGVEPGWQPAAMARGVALGIGVALLFGLRPVIDAMRVPPVRVLRRDADPLPVSRSLGAALTFALVLGVTATAWIQSGSVLRGVQFATGLTAATWVLAGAALLVVRMAGALPRDRGNVLLRHGLASLARPGSGTLGAVVALGLGVLTVLGMWLVQDRISARLEAELPDQAPTVFLVDIQPEQWAGVEAALRSVGASDIDSVPVVMARLASINGVSVADLAGGDPSGDRRWVLTREQRLTSLETLPEDNQIIAGELWGDPQRPEVSVEADFARDLGVAVGDVIVFDVQGVPLELIVSSIRSVEWESFAINFFLVVEPGVLDAAPSFRIAAARLDASAEQPLQNRLAAAFPNVTVIRIREVLDRVVSVLDQLGDGVRFLGAFTVVAGVAILAGAVSAGAVRRGRQVALFKTLGMTRAQVLFVFAVEYGLVGLVAGVLGVVGAAAMAWLVVRFGFHLDWTWRVGPMTLAIGGSVAVSVAAGLAASTRALTAKPLAVLRHDD